MKPSATIGVRDAARGLALALLVGASVANAAPPEPAEAIVPTLKAPFTLPADPVGKKSLIRQINDYMALPPAQVRSHPAAADFPGVVAAGAPRVTRVITVHGPLMHGPAAAAYDGAKESWQSTGLYANAGEIVTVTPVAVPAA